MRRITLVFFALCSCAPQTRTAPEWPTARPVRAQPVQAPLPEPTISAEGATPPRFPNVGERRLPGAKLWLVERPTTNQVRVRVVTRRGNDGAYTEDNLGAMLLTVREMLRDRLPGYEVNLAFNAHLMALEVVVRSVDSPSALFAINDVLDGPINEDFARRFLARSDHSLQPPDHLRQHLYSVSSEPLSFRTVEALTRCRNERFASSDRLVTVVGDFDTHEIVTAANEAFESAHELPRADAGELNLIRVERVSVARPGGSFAASLTLGAPAPSHPHFDVFNLILSLAEEPLPVLPSDNLAGPAPEVSAVFDHQRPGAVTFLSTGGDTRDAEAILEGLFRYYRQLITRAFSPRALDYARRLEWAKTQASFDHDPTNTLAFAFSRRLIPSQLEARYQAFEELTPETLLEMTRYYFAPGRILLSVQAPTRVLQRFIVVRNGNGFRLRVDPPVQY
ncbi:MAG: hypothetical protein AB8H86_17250 [Polyangiales bacterium]